MLILASASPRRSELLRNAGFEFQVAPANIREERRPNEQATTFAERMAQEKAAAIARARPHDVILAADTIVVVEGEILGKPRDAADAARMLRMLSGRMHQVTTGVAIAANGCERVASETTRVYMNPISDREIEHYVSTGEPMDKAGAYAIQGRASRWVPRIEGCYFNVVGLPVALVTKMLAEREAIL